MNRRICTSTIAALVCVALGLMMGCAGGSQLTVRTVTIMPTGGSGQNTIVGATFANKLVAQVMTGGSPSSGVSVTFTAPPSGAGGTFANGMATETDTTDANGNATSSTFTANKTSGAYMVMASVTGATAPADFNLTNLTLATKGKDFVFYLSGEEMANATNGGPHYYALAGSVVIDASGNVLGGEEDYNDGVTITQSALAVIGGTLNVNPNGQGTLTLVTNNATVVTETLGVQFVNASHALIIQFDGLATSSGSMDLQSATSAADGSFAFTLSGVDTNYKPVGYGGILQLAGGAVTGTADVNDNGTVATNTAFSGTVLASDAFGRGQTSGITIDGTLLNLNYYVVGSEVIRIIDMDVTGHSGVGGAAMGSAVGQGGTSFNNASLGASVMGMEQTDPFAANYAAAGMFTTDPTLGTFNGFGDMAQPGNNGPAPVAGSYSIASNGYGELHDTTGWGAITQVGVYMTDPALNLLDPNNPTGGGGALLLDLDVNDVHSSGVNLVGGVGIVIPQTDTSTASFAGNYAFGARDYFTLGPGQPEFDTVGLGTVSGASMAFTGTGLVNDDLEYFTATPARYTAVPFSGTVTPDPSQVGRYTISPLNVNPVSGGADQNFTVVIYQANGSQLVWLNESNYNAGTYSMFVGPLEQQGSLTGMPAAKKARAKHAQ